MFKLRKNKTFSYQSVSSKENESNTVLEDASKKDFVSKWRNNRIGKRKVRGVLPLRTLMLILVLLLICMYLLDAKFK